MIKTNANTKKMTRGQKDALDNLEWYLRGTLLSSLPGATIRLDEIEFAGCPHCALEAIEKHGAEEAVKCGCVFGEVTFAIGSPATPYTYTCTESIARIHVIHDIMKMEDRS